MRSNPRLAVTRRSVLLAFLSPWRGASPLQSQARMTMVSDGWDWLFRWCGLAPVTGLPAAG